MKFDLTKSVLDFKGKPILSKDEDKKDCDYTYQMMLQTLAVTDLEEDKDDFKGKSKKYKLGLKIFSHCHIELSDEDRIWLKERSALVWNSTLLSGRLGDFLDSPMVEEKK